MRTLYLLRHAKSSWKDASLRDFDRPLKERGKEAAVVVGQRLAAEKLKHPLVLCSPAVRTRETASIALASAKIKAVERVDERNYFAPLRDLLQVL
jgi:phosphohistidine phosphatase